MKQYRFLPILTWLFVASLLISGIVSTKIVQLWPAQFDGWTLLFPLSYIFGDILTEVYGYKRSRIVIRTWCIAMILMSGMIGLVGILPSSSEWWFQEDYHNILMLTPRIFLASIVAYIVGEFMNSYVVAKMKIKTQGEKLFQRLIWSTLVGEFFDTGLFVIIAFAWVLSLPILGIVALSNYIFKVWIEILIYPGTKRIINYIKTHEQEDYYDHDTNFNPFKIS